MRKGVKRMPSYGWIPDVKDDNDWKLSDHLSLPLARTPKGSNRKYAPWHKNQGAIGSCTGFGTTRAMRSALVKAGLSDIDLSELMAYYNGRLGMGTVASDSGASIRESIKAAVKYGVAAQNLWPYNISVFTQAPSPEAYTDGLNHIVLDYYTVDNNPDAINAALAAGFVITLGIPVYKSFEVAPLGDVPMPIQGEPLMGGHNIVLDEWDDSVARYGFPNSWGEWGAGGFGTISYDYITRYAADLWVVRATRGVAPPTPTPPPTPAIEPFWIITGANFHFEPSDHSSPPVDVRLSSDDLYKRVK